MVKTRFRAQTARPGAGALPGRSETHLSAWLGAIGICILFVALRWNNYDLPLIRDEGEYTYAAGLLKQGIPPYANCFLQKPPMIVYTYALASVVMPHVFWSARIFGYLFIAASTILLGWIARREFGPGIAMTAMWLFTPMVLLPGVDQFAANTEMFLLLPLLGTIAIFVLARGKSAAFDSWFWAGFLGAVTLWYKYTAAPVLLAVFVCWSIREWLGSGKINCPWRGWLAWCAGGLLATLLVLVFFMVRGGLGEMWNCTVQFNRQYAISAGNFGWAEMFTKLFEFLKNWWILFVVTFSLITSRNRRLIVWAGILLASLTAASRSYYSQYYMLMMPFWALLCAVGISHFASAIAATTGKPAVWIRRPMAMVVIALVYLPEFDWITYSKWDFYNYKMNTANPFRESKMMAEKVDELTATNDLIYVAGSEPQIYCYAGRRSMTRFDIAYPFMIPTSLAEGYQRQGIADLEKHPPAVIVFARAEQSWLIQEGTPPLFMKYLQKMIGDHYRVVGGTLAVGDDIVWKQPMTFEETAAASLVLMQRKKE